jgi:hypothetical protein
VRRAGEPQSGPGANPVREASLPPANDPTPTGSIPGNPGNTKAVGNAGSSPGTGSFGNPGKGKSN